MSEDKDLKEVWTRYVAAAKAYRASGRELLRQVPFNERPASADSDPLIHLLKPALVDPIESSDALTLLENLPTAYREALVDEIMIAALEWDVNHGPNIAFALLTGLNSEKVRSAFRQLLNQLIGKNPPAISTNVLALCATIDPESGPPLVELALASDDEYLQDIGLHFRQVFTKAP